MLKRFLPKEEHYYDDFYAMISHIHDMAAITHQLIRGEGNQMDLLLKLKPLEKRCDEILTKVVIKLNESFITPFDREDIFTLIKRLDNISDTLYAVGSRLEIFKLTQPIAGADRLTAIVNQQIIELEKAINGMRDKSSVMDACKAVKDLESEADVVFRNLTTKLFEEEPNAIELIKRKEILEILEHASDRCQDVSVMITSIIIKNA